jgi:ribosome-associated protein
MPESDKSQPDPHSKTKRKNDMLELQKLGKTLIDLPASQLAKITLPELLLDAIKLAHTLKANEAKRRHLQYVGKIMREIDCEEIKTTLKKIKFGNDQKTAQFHQAEEWRDKLIEGDDEMLQQFLLEHAQTDRQQLRQLIRKAKHDRDNQKNTGAETALFRFLRTLLG